MTVTGEERLNFLEARLRCLRQLAGISTMELEFAGDQGQSISVRGDDIRKIIDEAYFQTDFLSRRA